MRRRAFVLARSGPVVMAAALASACAAPPPAPVRPPAPPAAVAVTPPPAAAEPPAPPPVEPQVATTATASTAAPAAEPVDASGPGAPLVPSEAALRRDLARADDPTAAALELAARLVDEERLREALAALEAAVARQPSPLLRVARAGVLRDLGQRHLARGELEGLLAERGAEALHPSLLFELAELQWLEGDASSAARTLRELSDRHATDPWVSAHRQERESFAAEVARGGRPTHVRVRDLLGNLRGAPLATERLLVLQQLCNDDSVRGAAGAELRQRAVAIALGDDSGAVRAKAVRLAEPAAADAEAFVREALADPAPLVRQAAAERAVATLGARAPALLLPCLAAEADTTTFVALHEALVAATGTVDNLLPASVADAAGRAAVVARWRARGAQ